MKRFTVKIVGSQGQGVISTGEILAKCFKRSGYCVFGYREYNSLIKGGYTSYQIDVSDERIASSEERADIVIALNHHGFEHDLHSVKTGGLFIHETEQWQMPPDDQKFVDAESIRLLYLPVDALLEKLGAKPVMANVLFSAFAWAACGGDIDRLKRMVGEQFAHKPQVLDVNMQAIDAGYGEYVARGGDVRLALPAPQEERWSTKLLLTGSQAMGLGSIEAGCRMFVGYPMTPASPLLSFIAEVQNQTGMIIKQAEDEITAAQMMSGAMFMGTRAMTATSGGGFDLMTETVSLNGMIENPAVFVLAQRPGPATGLPTWTAQGDLWIAIHGGHGEFARCVLSASDAGDARTVMHTAFNIADRYQTPVIVLTDKHIAEGIYTEDFGHAPQAIDRGRLVTDSAELSALSSSDRYDPSAPDGISPRWLPGSEAATYCAQGDEHSPDGSVDETAQNALLQMDKRMRKLETMRRDLPEPVLYVQTDAGVQQVQDDPELQLLVVGWGSTKSALLDAMDALSHHNVRGIGYLHWSVLWPMKTERFVRLHAAAKHCVLLEGNATGQLGILLRQHCGIHIEDTLCKYDGRPFFAGETIDALSSRLPS